MDPTIIGEIDLHDFKKRMDTSLGEVHTFTLLEIELHVSGAETVLGTCAASSK